jgi:hypothetical protein
MKSHLVFCLLGLAPLLGCSAASDRPASERSTAGAPASTDAGAGGELPKTENGGAEGGTAGNDAEGGTADEPSGGSGGGPDVGGSPCYPSTTTLRACSAVSFCPPSSLDTQLDSANCSQSCRFTYQVNLGDTLTYEDDDIYLLLRFGSGITGATTEDQLKAAFWHYNLMRTFPTTGPEGTEVIVFTQSTNIGDFETFELRDGVLHVRIPYTLSSPYVWVRSNDSGCRDDDVIGECTCSFAPPVATGIIELTLPADIPMPG